MSEPLTAIQSDLHKYAQGKLYNAMKDIVQAFRIAKEEDAQASACLGSMMLRMAATLAVHGKMPPDSWARHCAECWDLAVAAHEEFPD